jgi:hypothetical protein
MNRQERLRSRCAVFLTSALFTAGVGAQIAAVEWHVPVDVGPLERGAILEIARRAGIGDPGSVSEPMHSSCLLIRIESRPVFDGNRVLSSVLGVRQFSGPACEPVGADSRVERQGNWIAFLGELNPRRRELWRIRDGDWHIDIALGAAVPYDDAVSIVHAIRRKQLVDRRPPSREASSEIRDLDPSAIRSVQTAKTLDSHGVPVLREYEITTGETGGDWLTVRIRDGVVELHQHGQWIA